MRHFPVRAPRTRGGTPLLGAQGAVTIFSPGTDRTPYLTVDIFNNTSAVLQVGTAVRLDVVGGVSIFGLQGRDSKIVIVQEAPIPRGKWGKAAWCGTQILANAVAAPTGAQSAGGYPVRYEGTVVDGHGRIRILDFPEWVLRIANVPMPEGVIGFTTAPWDSGSQTVPIALWAERPTPSPFEYAPGVGRGLSRYSLFEDFLGAPLTNLAGTGSINMWPSGPWTSAGATPELTTPYGGVARAVGDGTTAGLLRWSGLTDWNVTQSPCFYVRWAQDGVSAATRIIGLSVTDANANPANGIFFRHTNAGNIFAVVRVGGVDQMALDSGVAAAANVYHEGVMAVVGGEVYSWLDSVFLGNFAPTFPVGDLRFNAGGSAVSAGQGLRIDYMGIDAERP